MNPEEKARQLSQCRRIVETQMDLVRSQMVAAEELLIAGRDDDTMKSHLDAASVHLAGLHKLFDYYRPH